MNVNTALEYAAASKGNQELFARASRVLAKEVTRYQNMVNVAPVQKRVLPNGTEVTVALVALDDNT